MKHFTLLVLLMAIAAGQGIRLESVHAEKPAQPPKIHLGPDTESVLANEPAMTAAAEARARALAKWHAEPYIVEPPDVLLIKSSLLVPNSPHTIQTSDMIRVRAAGTYPNQPIDNAYSIDKDGSINLGPTYGRIKVTGLPLGKVKDEIRKALAPTLTDVHVSVSLLQPTVAQQVHGEHVVGPDGRVNLGDLGSVFVAGMTVEQVRAAIENSLAADIDNPKVSVDVAKNYSKVVYVVSKQPTGDYVVRIPHTGTLTVLDAIACSDLDIDAIHRAYVLSPSGEKKSDCRLEIALKVLRSNNNVSANFELLPGDRVFLHPTKSSNEENKSPPAVVPPQEFRGSSSPDRVQNQSDTGRYVVTYSVADWLAPADGSSDATTDRRSMETIIHAITSTIDAETWVASGGEGNAIHPLPGKRALVALCNKSTHEKLTLFIRALRTGKHLQMSLRRTLQATQVTGPLTTGGPPRLLDPPSDAEVLKSLHISMPTAANPRVSKELVVSYNDPEKTYPIVGRAVQHHAVYKCRVQNGEAKQVVYVDHNHLHVAP